MANGAIRAEGAGTVAGTTGIRVRNHIAGGNILHHLAQEAEDILFQKLQFFPFCQITGANVASFRLIEMVLEVDVGVMAGSSKVRSNVP